MSLQTLRDERLKKLRTLEEAGMEPYPVKSGRTVSGAEFLSKFDVLEKEKKEETLAGRIMSRRGQGGIIFLDVFDGTEKIQAVVQKDELDSKLFSLLDEATDIGDFVEISGLAYTTKRGEKSILVKTWKMLAKSLVPLPDSWFGLEDKELKLRERDIDILMNPELRQVFVRKAHFWRTIRRFLEDRGFMEVETPAIEVTPGGADARPFITHHNALNIEAYMRICAGELWQKRLLVAGYPKVFEIGRIFRNEGMSSEHVQDYTQCEFYEAYSDYTKGMELVRDLYRTVVREVYGKEKFEIRGHSVDFGGEWGKIDFCEEIKKQFGVDPIKSSEEEIIKVAKKEGVELGDDANRARAVDGLWKKIRKNISGPVFLVGVPAYLEPLAKRVPGREDVVERFQPIIAGSEMGKGFSELNNPIDQKARMEEQEKLREGGDEEAQRLDTTYINAMEHGMPPAFGFGISERLFSFLEDMPVHEAQIFPLLRPRGDK